MNLDLRDPMEITSVPDLKVDLDEINEDGDDNEDVVVVTAQGTVSEDQCRTPSKEHCEMRYI